MTREAYRDFYKDGVYRKLVSTFHGRPINVDTLEPEQEKYAEKVVRLLGNHPQAWRAEEPLLLDVGGSTGVVAEAVAKRFSLKGTILEPSEAEGKRAKSRGLRVVPTTIEDWEPGCGLFHVVLLCQTIDHLLDIAGSLRTIRAALEDDGLFFVDFVENCAIKIDHPFHLTRDTTKDYLRRTGFRVLAEAPDADGLHYNLVCGRA
jgi:2-polyprenyl-3-methyl-5-hydroxy-6-metoxy-1,4-benzoquinol methylase